MCCACWQMDGQKEELSDIVQYLELEEQFSVLCLVEKQFSVLCLLLDGRPEGGAV